MMRLYKLQKIIPEVDDGDNLFPLFEFYSINSCCTCCTRAGSQCKLSMVPHAQPITAFTSRLTSHNCSFSSRLPGVIHNESRSRDSLVNHRPHNRMLGPKMKLKTRFSTLILRAPNLFWFVGSPVPQLLKNIIKRWLRNHGGASARFRQPLVPKVTHNCHIRRRA